MYQKPKVEIIELDAMDIVVASTGGLTDPSLGSDETPIIKG